MAGSNSIVISEVYGGGGNANAAYANDFIVIHNVSNSAINLAGYTLQYASAAGAFSATSNDTALSGTIAAGGYALIREASGGATGAALPAADITGTTNLSASSGKVVLVNGALLTTATPTAGSYVDLVGYGGANVAEGSAAAGPSNNATSVQRLNYGGTDTDNNSADFTVAAPTAYNSASPTHGGAAATGPVFTSGATATQAENTPAATPVYTAQATDPSTVAYSLGGGADAAKFIIDATSGDVTFQVSPDFEARASAAGDNAYKLVVLATDAAGHTATQAVTVNVTDVNDNAPLFTAGATATATAPQLTPTTTAVYTAAATDADSGPALTYAITGGADAAKFNIDAATGAISFKAPPSYASPDDAGADHVYNLAVTASDGVAAHNAVQAVAITVTNTNVNAPVLTSPSRATAADHLATNVPVYTVQATDADNDALTYSIAGGADAAKFNINAATGAVTFVTPPSYANPDDAGADHTYDIVVQAADGLAAHNVTKPVAITVANPTSGVLFSANFDSYTASGLSPGGTVAGTLDSNVWMAVGFSDAQPGYGGTVGTGDYGRGLLAATGDPSGAGLYSGVTGASGAGDHALLIQPTGTEFDVNGYVELRVQNATGSAVTSLSTSFDWVYHNNEARGDNLQLAYSTDGVNYTLVPAANLTTPTTATVSPVPFTYVHEDLTFDPGSVVAPGAYLYLRFEHPSSTGANSRDEVGIDNVAVSYAAVSHTPLLSAANVTGAEGNGGTTPFTFTIQRTGDLGAATTVHYATADGTATAGSDYTAVQGDLTFAPGEASHTVTVPVTGDTAQEPDETFTLALSGATNATLPTTPITGTITNDDVNILGIADVQGASQTSPFAGSTVTTQGVVTAIKTGAGGGYYIQDSLTTGPAGASHGLFVFTNATPSGVAVGDAVTVTGLVTEYQAGGDNLSVTELNNPTFTVTSHNNAVTPIVIGQGGVLPPTGVIAPATPYDPAHSGADFYESLEGQIVTIHNAQAVDGTYSGSTWVVADNGAETTGLNARGGITVSATDFNPERIQVYSTALNASMGEQLGDITGVLTYYSSDDAQDPNIGGEYELVPTAPITPPGNSASTAPALPLPTTTLQGDATHVSIGAYNLENLGPVEPGVAQATVDARFALLGKDIAQNLHAPDILGLEEIQDSDGEGTGSDLSGSATLNKLIAAIAAAGGPTYQYVEIAPTTTNTNGGAPNGNIRSAYLYNPARVSYVAGSAQLLNDPNTADGDAFANSRHPLAAKFTFNGQTINAIDVHDYARSGSQELFGSNQPPVNSGDQRRVDQTASVNAYVSQLLAADPTAKVTVQGDFNGFQFEPTLTQLTHAGGGQLNQLSDLLPANERYSTTFEGDAQEIDHLLVSDSLLPGAAFDIVHLNTGQPAANQGSDHDPIVSLLSVPGAAPPPPANTHAPVFSSGATASAPRNVGPATPVYTAHAADADGDTLTYAIAGGADAARFDIDAATGAVTFRTAPSYANPDDAGADHVYDIVVSASDGVAAHTASQAVAISLPDPSTTPGATAAPPTVAPGQTVTIDASAPGVITGDVADSGVLQIAASASVGFSGSISGTGSLVKAGAGVLTLSGVSTYTGTTSVTGGELVVDGSIAASAVVVGPGGILGGHGTTGSVTLQAGAGLSPGNSPGTLATGALTLGAGAVLNEEIGGVGAGGFDLLRVTGAVTLAGATLNTTLYGGFAAPTTSSPLVVIDKDGTDAVVGTFAGLAEGAVFALGGQQVKISYVGGTGSDVTLQFVSGGGGGGVVPAAPAPTPSQQAGYATLAGNLIRVAAGDPALGDPSSPLYAQVQAETAIAARLDAGQIGPADAQTALFHLVDATTSVAETAYAFFTGRTPTAAGLSYLVHSPANPTDLNDPYYAQFTTENRYINFGVNLATGQGAGAAAFQASYGALTLADATAKAYAAVFGFAPVAGKVDAILDAQVSNGLGGTETRAQYFADISGGGALAQKAAVAGFLLSDSVKEGFGAYQQADLHFLGDLAHGTATYNVDLLAAYRTAPTLVGQPVVDAGLPH